MKLFSRILLPMAALAAMGMNSDARAATVKVDALQTQLQQAHAGWTAKDNWVNQLGEDQLQRMLGYKHVVPVNDDVEFSARPGTPGGTDSIDWRNYNGQNWVTPILNQGNCGSCVAYSTIGTLETQMNISRQAPWLNNHYSPDALFACGGGGCDAGWEPADAASFLKSNGAVDAACSPETMSATGVDVSCSAILCADASKRSQTISDSFTPSSAAEVKAALKKGPLVTTLNVYADFVVYSSGIYKHTTGKMEGGHAVSIVGFDDVNRYWIVRNSWGPDWGENGFIRVSYDDKSGVGKETWGFDIPNAAGTAAIKELHDQSYLAGNVTLNGISTYPNTKSLTLAVKDASGKITNVNCDGSSCALQLQTANFADGRYEGTLLVNTNDGKQMSGETKYFYIANNQPAHMDLSFQAATGTNLSKAVTDRIVFNVNANSSSVPYTSVTLVVKQGDQTILTKAAEIVLPQMTLGWRTNTVPNGTYDIYLTGVIDTGVAKYQAESNHFTVTTKN